MVTDRWSEANEALICDVYPELREMAGRLLRRERQGHTLQRTALVHEAFLRLFGTCPAESTCARSFLALVAHQMRYILIDYGRKHRSLKSGGGFTRVQLFDGAAAQVRDEDTWLALDEALDELGEVDARALAVVELKFFAGFTNEETAEILDVSGSTVDEDWQFARSWLYGMLTDKAPRFRV